MMEFPYFSPHVMTDTIYVEMGGHVGTSSPSQRQAAYLIAEKQMTQQIGTFLLLETITGTFPWPGGHIFVTPYSHIRSIDDVTILSQDCACDCDLTESNGCALIHSDTYGYLLVRSVEGCASNCGCQSSYPYQFRMTMTAGLGSGTCYSSDILLALTMVAEINLNEIIDPGANEGMGDIGIQTFSNQSYSENRVRLKRTSFGSSARANKAAQLVNGYRRYRALKMGW